MNDEKVNINETECKYCFINRFHSNSMNKS